MKPEQGNERNTHEANTAAIRVVWGTIVRVYTT